MELFTFIRMGGKHERVKVVEIEGTAAKHALGSFDAARAQCFHKHDRQKLLAIVEASFGDFVPFNQIVCHLLERRLERKRPNLRLLDAVRGFSQRQRGIAAVHAPASSCTSAVSEEESI